MPKFLLNKLVRRRLPEFYVQLGEDAEVKELVGKELEIAVLDKIVEEAKEARKEEKIDLKELADILQLLHDAAGATGAAFEDLEEQRKVKEAEKGGSVFMQDGTPTGYFIEGLTCDESDKWTAYYRKEPDRFPEIKE